MIIAFLQWTTPLMLAGLALLSLPIIAHLLNRRTRRRVVVPTVRFIELSLAQQNRHLELKRWLLLLLRCLAVALLVLAFARPIWLNDPQADPQDQRALALVIDASLSTSQKIGNADVFQRIRGSAERLVDDLKRGRDRATVVIARRQPEALVRKLSPNLSNLKRLLASTHASYQRSDLRSAVQLAARQLEEQAGHKVLAILTDWQASNWEEALEAIRLPADIDLRLVDLGLPPGRNAGLGRINRIPADPIENQTIQLSAQLSNYSPGIRQIPVTLKAGQATVQQKIYQLDPWETAVVSFEFEWRSELGREFNMSLPSDALLADNVAFIELHRRTPIPTAVIADDLVDDPGSSAFFIARALRPFNNANDRFDVENLAASEIEPGRLETYKTVVVGYIAHWTQPAVKELVRFVQSGGNLIYWCGEGNVAAHLSQIDEMADGPVFPFRLGNLDRFRNFDRALYISSGKWRSRWLSEFDLTSQVSFGQLRFANVWQVTDREPDAEILLNYSDGRPALGVRPFGAGQVVLCNFGPSVEFSDFGKQATFVALMQILMHRLQDNVATSSAPLVGDSLKFAVPSHCLRDADYSVVGPDGEPVEAMTETKEGKSHWTVDQTQMPGNYELRANQQILESLAVNVDPRESDLRRLNSQQRETLASNRSSTINYDGQFSFHWLEQGQPLWGWLLVSALLVLGLESLLVGWWRR